MDRRARSGSEGFSRPTSLYVHVPFCSSRCAYCDFFSSVPGLGDEGVIDRVVDATIRRIDELSDRFGTTDFVTVYVGGGTPSFLPGRSLRRLLRAIGRRASGVREWTVEANPEGVDRDFLSLLEDEGVTRISLGVQSLDDQALAALGRGAKSSVALAALRAAAASRLHVSADLIAGFPRRDGLVEEARIVAEEGIGHLSVYDLTLEEGTALARLAERGEFAMQDEDEAADERAAMEALLRDRGILRYEVSNYALPGWESSHNLVYWRMGSWLGVGPGASGTIERLAAGPGAIPGLDGGSIRIDETRVIGDYIAGLAAQRARETDIGPAEAAFEVMMMGFRTVEGLDPLAFRRRFGLGPRELVAGTLAKWAPRLAVGNRITLDGPGLDLLNRFLSECLGELERNFPSPQAAIQTKKS